MKSMSIMYAVVHKESIEPSVKLMGRTRNQAKRLWEWWNPMFKFEDMKSKDGWVIRKYSVTLR